MASRDKDFKRKREIKGKIKTDLIKTLPNIFKNREEAEWAFDLLKETILHLRIEDPKDVRFSIYFNPKRPYFYVMFTGKNDKNGPILGFDNSDYFTSCRVKIMLRADLKSVDERYMHENIDQYTYEPDFRIYKIPIKTIMVFEENIRQNYRSVLDYISHNNEKSDVAKISNKKSIEKIAIDEIFLKAVSEQKERDELFQDFKNDNFPKISEYPLNQCAQDTGFDLDMLERWARAIERKGQAVLYGPPGTGKTYVAEHLAKHLIGGGDGFSDLVQFHPAYAYEDFIQGIRPLSRDDGGLDYPTVPGRFLEFCEQAESRQGTCVLIIDEINRANLARVFGELMYLLEYRERDIPLAGGETLRIPENVRIIGTMNTADRSIALVDHALRRRFAFLRLQPNYDILSRYHQKRDTGFSTEGLVKVLRRLNEQINDPHYEVGITFFLRENLDEEIEDIWKMEIEPYLEEYFFDQPENVRDFRWEKVQREILP